MRVEMRTEGGLAFFPGLNKTIVVDSQQLPEEVAVILKQQVAAVDFFALPTQLGKLAAGAADCRSYFVTVEENGKRHAVELIEPVADEKLQRLLAFLKLHGR